jgi:aminopeptidase N
MLVYVLKKLAAKAVSILSPQLALGLFVFFIVSACAPRRAADLSIYSAAPEGQILNQPRTRLLPPTSAPYRPEVTRFFDLIHTRLELEPVWEKREMKGLATLIIAPHAYAQKQVTLDAKYMAIRAVVRTSGKGRYPLSFSNDSTHLYIKFDSLCLPSQRCSLEIEYTARPSMVPSRTLEAITDERGLYFINHKGNLPNRPRELWTQGEPEANSVWFPTFDSPNQKSTQEVLITVDTSYTTLSNGVLVYQTKLAGGRRTDVWEMKLPHSPYLFMLAVGPFAIVKDKWRDIEVNYYVEKQVRNNAKAVFGRTPEMIEFFSKKLGVAYPWPKYAQVSARDYVSGAMENTTATLHSEEIMGDAAMIADKDYDATIAHELFHQWFGNLVTCESWANLSLNEGFANYSEYLWAEYKKGIDEADIVGLEERLQYFFSSRTKQEPIVRYKHKSPNDMFDAISYSKGGRVLHMLRKQLGDDVFFNGLQQYLKKFSFKKAEIHDFRLVMEEASGEDLNWFFDQWYFRTGHPVLTIRKTFTGESLLITVQQRQDTTYTPIFRFPIEFDIYQGERRERHTFIATEGDNTFEIPMGRAPSLMVADPDNTLLAEFRYDQPTEERVHEFLHNPRALGRANAIEEIAKKANPQEINLYLRKGLADQSSIVRIASIEAALQSANELEEATRQMMVQMAQFDKNIEARAAATGSIGVLKIEPVLPTLIKILDRETSYLVQAEALNQYVLAGGREIKARLKKVEYAPSPEIVRVVAELYGVSGLPEGLEWFSRRMHDYYKENQLLVIKNLGLYVASSKGEEHIKAIEMLNSLVPIAPDSPTIYEALRLAIAEVGSKDQVAIDLNTRLKAAMVARSK